MARIIRRPWSAVNWGSTNTVGTGNILGDNNYDTYNFYPSDSGSILVFREMTEAQMPANPVIAVMVGFDQSNGGFLGRYNGWVCGYMRVGGVRDPATKTYVQDQVTGGTRKIVGPPLYKADAAAFTAADIDSLSMDVGAAVGPIGPATNRRWCIAREAYLILVTAEPVQAPALVFPTEGQVLSSSNVLLTSYFSTHDRAQPVRAVFEVASDAAFTTDVQTFVGDYASLTGESRYTPIPGRPSATDLGPGTWYVRAKGRDFRDVESTWGAARSFSIVHPALHPSTPVIAPVVHSPYAVRSSNLDVPSGSWGGRKLGTEWQFSRKGTFVTVPVTWTNVTDGRYDNGPVSYDPSPDTAVEPGGHGYKVGYDDPSQYLAQGSWYVRTRTVDRWGQFSPWATSASFEVAHQPGTTGHYPTGGIRFDPEAMEVSWAFTDPWPDDRQSGYEVSVYDSTNSVVWTSGTVQSPLSRARLSVPGSLFGQTLSWSVRVFDADNVASALSPRQTFRYSRVPAVTITSPSATVISGMPPVSWTAVLAESGLTATSWRVAIGEVGSSRIVYDTGTVIGADVSHTPQQPILADGNLYDVRVSVTDSSGLTGTATLRIATQFVRPPGVPLAVSAAPYAEQGCVSAFWTRGPDPMFVRWNLYRRRLGTTDWEPAAASTDASARSMQDWLASGDELEYALTQVASRDGSLVESLPVDPPPVVRLPSSTFMLVVPAHGFAMAVRPSGDSFTRTVESHTMKIIGRGDKVNFGAGRSREGSLSVPLRDPFTAHLDRATIDTLIGGEYEVWLRSPFGDAFRVALTEYSFERLPGVGSADLGDLEIPYVEVSE